MAKKILLPIKHFASKHVAFLDVGKNLYRDYRKYHLKCIAKSHFSIFNHPKWRQIRKDYYIHKIYKKYNCHIGTLAYIGKGTSFPHPLGLVIGSGTRIGTNCTIYQNVTIGRRNPKDPTDLPTIGDNVLIGCNSVILGKINIGDNAKIAAGSVVLRDVKPGETVYGIVK